MAQRNTKKTTEEFKEEVYQIEGNSYEVLGEYKSGKEKILMKHILCGTEFLVAPHNFLSTKNRCPECAKQLRRINKTKKFSDVIEKLKENGVYDEIEILSNFSLNQRLKKDDLIKIRIKKTGEEHLLKVHSIKKIKSFEKGNFFLNTFSYQKRILNRNPNLEFLSEYIGNKEKIKVKCTLCGTIIERTANNLMTNPSCPSCNKKNKKPSIKSLYEKASKKRIDIDEYEIDFSNYENHDTKLKFKHKKCGTEFTTSFHSFTGKGKASCPFCRSSYYEKYIAAWLSKNNIKFIKEYKFDDCVKKDKLPFDFYLEDFDILIEYDGRQHYLPIYGEESFLEVQENDKIKNEFCFNNDKKLIRIPYFLYKNIDEILNQIINKKPFVEICEYINLQGSTTIPDEVVKFHNRSRAQNAE